MLKETIENLLISDNVISDRVYVDCTFGRGGHAIGILNNMSDADRLLIIDKDEDAIEHAKLLNDNRLIIRHGSFDRMKIFLEKERIYKIDGVIADLGMSSTQVDDSDRGFSFLHDGPLDMRMSRSQRLDAKFWLNKASENEISNIIRIYGEERHHRKIAKAIIEYREKRYIRTTGQLVKIIESIIPHRYGDKHPATRVFQAIRIHVNDELREIENLLNGNFDLLKIGCRFLVISFHSLEHRIIKRFIKERKDIVKCVDKILPSNNEISTNNRARSAILWIMEKTKDYTQ